jgi:hypothetical protein
LFLIQLRKYFYNIIQYIFIALKTNLFVLNFIIDIVFPSNFMEELDHV